MRGSGLRFSLLAIALAIGRASIAAPADAPVEMELMTYAEVQAAIHQQGKTTVLVYNGGTEQRGPHAVLGGHTLIARETAKAIARRLGNALVAPVLPFSPTKGHLNPNWPGTISLPEDLYAKVNEAVADSLVVAGFKNIILMGDHGGGQKELGEVARRLDAKYSPRGTHVRFCGAVYAEASRQFDAWLKAHGYPTGTHAGIPDTSELLYLGGDAYVRKDKLVAGNATNGINGDPRRSSAELGQRYIEMKIALAVAEIGRLTER
jgi:creatinine amidohydrolase/Fe(II)-dependent formamide hydrolase-like protein